MQDLTGILLKFRTNIIAFTVDIKKAFGQIELNNQDRDATSFLWLKDINKSVNGADNLIQILPRSIWSSALNPLN